MPDQSGFEIKGKFYPLATSFRLGDTALVERVTGLEWPQFCDRLPDEDADPTKAEDLVVMAGLVAVSWWQEHTNWRRERVALYVEQLDLTRVKFVAADPPDDDEEEDPPVPTPAGKAGAKSSKTSQEPSSEEPELPDGGDTTPGSSGPEA